MKSTDINVHVPAYTGLQARRVRDFEGPALQPELARNVLPHYAGKANKQPGA